MAHNTTVSALPLKVLVIDDNVPSALTLMWIVEASGYLAHVAYDGISGLRTASDIKPDVILLDIGMPMMNGFEVCKAIRLDPDLSDVVVIAQTGWGHAEFRAKGAEAGFDHHLVKPISIDTLGILLAQVSAGLPVKLSPSSTSVSIGDAG